MSTIPQPLARDLGQLMDWTVTALHETGLGLGVASQAFEKCFIEHVLAECRGNKCAAARELGMHRNTLDRHIELHKIDYRQFLQKGRYYQRWRINKSSADHGQQEVNQTAGAPESATPGFTNSVRKAGRGESPEPSRGGEVATASTAHLAQSSKPPRGYIPDDLEVECGGLKA